MDNSQTLDIKIGDISPNGNCKVLDMDRLCYLVEVTSRGKKWNRTFSKKIAIEPTTEKNVLTALVPKSEDGYEAFVAHTATSYVMRKIPSVNLMEVKYLLPMVGGDIDGVYRIDSFKFGTFKDEQGNTQPCLRFKLGQYISLGEQWTKIYRVKMQPGEVISMRDSLELYG